MFCSFFYFYFKKEVFRLVVVAGSLSLCVEEAGPVLGLELLLKVPVDENLENKKKIKVFVSKEYRTEFIRVRVETEKMGMGMELEKR